MFEKGKQIIVGLTFQRRSEIFQHINVWRSVVKPDKTNYQIVRMQTEFDDVQDVLLFNNSKAYEEFNSWWTQYTERFDRQGYVTGLFPTIPDGDRIEGWVLKHDIGRHSYEQRTKQFKADWLWICEFIQDRVRWSNEFWLFDNEADMVMFKLKGKANTEEEDIDLPF